MKEFKGTQGEWEVYKNNPKMVLTDKGAYSPNARMVAITTKEEMIANAKLIAASKKLLKALQDFLSDYKNDTISMGTVGLAELAINEAL
tara:strand:+ start:983 stop:1249 length:267 start_codon:yes stop_codon:yes gene_type:complete